MEYLCRPRLGRTMRRLVAQLALGLALAGCTLGPDYHRPTVSAPEVWRAAQAAPEPASLADLAWWELFQDDELRRLVQTATEANKDRSEERRVGKECRRRCEQSHQKNQTAQTR